MTKKIAVLLGLLMMAFAAGCGETVDKTTTEFAPTDSAIQAARMKIAALKDAYEDDLEKIGEERQKTVQVGGLEDDERDRRQAALEKKVRGLGRALVDGVRAAIEAVPQETRKANPIEYLRLMLKDPVYTYHIPSYSQQQAPRRVDISLLRMEGAVYGLTPERSQWYAEAVIELFDPAMDEDKAKDFMGMMGGLLVAGDVGQSLEMVEKFIEKDPKGDFWLSLGKARERWALMKAGILSSLGDYKQAKAINETVAVTLDGEELEAQQESMKALREAEAEMEREEKERAKDEKKTGEDELLPRARITFVGEDGKDKGAVEVVLFEDGAFNAVANFISLVESGYYNDKEIYMTRPHMLEAASKFDCGGGEPDYSIEAKSNRGIFRGTLAYPKGESGKFDIFKYQVSKDQAEAVPFGRIVEGIDYIDTLAIGDRIKEITIIAKRKGSVYEPVKEKKGETPQFDGQDMMPTMPTGR